jgi:hypothetical protein
MTLPASLWALVAFNVLVGALCRRWPAIALYGAVCAFCNVFRAHLIPLPSDPAILFADAIMFCLPSVVLLHACGVSELRSIQVMKLAPIAMILGYVFGADVRIYGLMLGIGFVQGMAAIRGTRDEIGSANKSMSRWAAVILAVSGVVGLAFLDVWRDVAWTGVAAHAFVCVAYLAYDEQK